MDLSKLPRLSETDKNAPPPQPAQTASVPAAPLPAEGSGPQVWLSAVLGVVFMLVGRNFARFIFARMTGQPFHTGVNWMSGPKAGQEVDYFELSGYTAYTEAGIFLFGLAMVLEAAVLALVRRNTSASRLLVMIALAVTAMTTLLNLGLAVALFSINIMPLSSLLVVAFGGFMAHWQWKLLRQMLAEAPV